MNQITFRSEQALHEGAARFFEEKAVRAIRARGRFLVALSGGRTPIPTYNLLARSQRIDWNKVGIFWSDERCVPPSDPASNFSSARDALLDHASIPQNCVHRIHGEDSPAQAADAYETVIRDIIPDGRFDLILLGMGVDGHTASLFPDHKALDEIIHWVVPVCVPAEPPHRITMTLPLIVKARHILMLTIGDEKEQVRQRIVGGEQLPAGRVKPVDGTMTWYASHGP